MTPKQKYDERKRLRTERLLREERRARDHHERDQDMEARMIKLMSNFERIADVMELWADLQVDPADAGITTAAHPVVDEEPSGNLSTFLHEKVREVILRVMGSNKVIGGDENLIDLFEMDSLDMVEVLMELESVFGIEVPDEHAQNEIDTTVNGIVAYLERVGM